MCPASTIFSAPTPETYEREPSGRFGSLTKPISVQQGGASHGCIGRVSVMLNEVKECATKDICTQTLIERSAIGPRVGRVWDALSTKVVEEAATSAAHLRASVLLRCHLNARSKARSTTIACRSAPRFFLAFSPTVLRRPNCLKHCWNSISPFPQAVLPIWSGKRWEAKSRSQFGASVSNCHGRRAAREQIAWLLVLK
jgi:hypothetical protein